MHTFRKDQICIGGEGPVNAPIMIVGVTRPMPEAQQRIMDAVIAELDMVHMTYQTALTRCNASLKPTVPNATECRACFSKYLSKEVAIIDPAIMVMLGEHVVEVLWSAYKPFRFGLPLFAVEAWRSSQVFRFLDRRVLFPVRHPEEVVRGMPNALTDIISQLRSAKEFYLENFQQTA